MVLRYLQMSRTPETKPPAQRQNVKNSHKFVILSGAPHRFIALHSAASAQSKDLGGACLTYAASGFSTTKAREQDPLRYALDVHGVNLFMHQGKTVAGL